MATVRAYEFNTDTDLESVGQQVDAKVKAYQEQNEGVEYKHALNAVLNVNPSLKSQYAKVYGVEKLVKKIGEAIRFDGFGGGSNSSYSDASDKLQSYMNEGKTYQQAYNALSHDEQRAYDNGYEV